MILVSSGQSLLDICLQELGSVAAAFDLADANNLAITDHLTPGQQLTLPASVLSQPEIVAYFAGRMQRINTGGTPAEQPPIADLGYFNPNFFNSEYYS